MKKKFTATILVLCVSAILWHRVALASTQNSNALCPAISNIHKNPKKGNWFAETSHGKWKSYDMSFATNITQFTGAQWVGENVGQITCIYNSEQQFTIQGQPTIQATLPVLLVFHTLSFQPTKGKWKHIKRGVYNCYSPSRSRCPFKVNMKPPVGNVLQQAESLKSHPGN